jgi:oleate hydratase
LSFTTLGRTHTLELGAHDHVLATLGSMTANAAHGDDDDPPKPDLARRDETWRLWESISRRQPDLGRPDVFTSRVQDTAWLSFTLTMTTPDLTWCISDLTGNRAGTGGLVTFRDSPWLLTLAVPRQPHFTGQVPEVQTALGYGLRLDADGDYAPVSMLRASGRQLVDELIGQFGVERRATNVRMTTSVRSVLLPYAGSPLIPRRPGDRPLPVPAGARNFAFLGQTWRYPARSPSAWSTPCALRCTPSTDCSASSANHSATAPAPTRRARAPCSRRRRDDAGREDDGRARSEAVVRDED